MSWLYCAELSQKWERGENKADTLAWKTMN